MLVWTVQSKPVSDFFTSCAVMDKRRIHAAMWLFMELSSRPAIWLPLMDNGLLMEKVINDKRRLLAATVQSSWCYTTLDLSLHLPGAIWCSLARSLWESISLLPPRPASGGDEPWRRTQASFPLLNFGIRLENYASCIFICQMTIMAAYLLPIETRYVLGKYIFKN